MDLKKLLSIVTEAELTPQQQAQNVMQPGANPTAPTNPWPNDPVKAAAWEKLSPQIKAKIGGADPTDKIIISAMADGSGWGRAKGINDANPDGTPKVKAPVATATPVAPATNAVGVTPQANVPGSPTDQSGKPATATDPEKEKKVARFKELLTKAGMLTATPATPAASSDFKIDYNLAAGASKPGLKLPGVVNESVAFKSSIGRMLLESFDIGLEEAVTQLSPEEYKELAKLYGDLSVTYKDDPALTTLFAAYDKVKPSWSSDQAAPAAPAAGANLGLAQMQKELKAQGANLGTFGPNKDGIDGKMGKFTKDAIAKYPEIAKKYGFNPDGSKAPDAVASDKPAAPATGKVDQSGKPAAPATPAAPGAVKVPTPELTKAVPSPTPGQKYWISGDRYEFSNGQWAHEYGPANPSTQGGITRSWVSTNARTKYSGPDGEGLYGKTPAEPTQQSGKASGAVVPLAKAFEPDWASLGSPQFKGQKVYKDSKGTWWTTNGKAKAVDPKFIAAFEKQGLTIKEGETVGYSQDQSIASIVHLAGLK
jgi:hypothetical protein